MIIEKVGVRLCFTSASLSSLLYSDTDIESVLMDLPIYQIIVSDNSFNIASDIEEESKEISLALAMYHSHILRQESNSNHISMTEKLSS